MPVVLPINSMMPAYPISISSDGGLSISSDPEVDNVRALIDTQFYERVMFPEYGMPVSLFDALASSDIDLVLLQLNLVLSLWHSFITSADIDSSQLDSGILGVQLTVSGRETRIELT